MNAPLITIHRVSAANATLLLHVDDDVFDHAVDPLFLREFLDTPSNVLFVAVDDDVVVGMATGLTYVHPDKPRAIFINEVGVSAKYRRRGIGRRLVAAILEWGQSEGCSEAWVATEVDNVAARSLYRSLGGVEDDEHAVVYVYPLSPRPSTSAAPRELLPAGVPRVVNLPIAPSPDLLELVLDEFRHVLRTNLDKAHDSANRKVQRYGYVEQTTWTGDSSRKGKAVAAWHISTTKVYPSAIRELPRPPLDGKDYDTLIGWFQLSDDLSTVSINWQAGPRFGRGFDHRIGKDATGRFLLDRGRETWVS